MNYSDQTQSYPVIYMHDGQNVFEDKDATQGISLDIKKYLDVNKLEIIVVGIDTNMVGDERKHEYCHWVDGEFSKNLMGTPSYTGDKGEAYSDFIVNELKPFIDSKYRTLIDSISIAGISLGGLISVYAACKYPQVFTKVAALSSTFGRNQEKLEELIRKTDLSALEKLYMDSGTTEMRENERISKGFLESNQRIFDLLNDKGVNVQFTIIEDAEHNYTHFKKRVPEMISYLFK